MPAARVLNVPPSEWIAENALAFAIRDPHPVNVGHTLVLLKRSVGSWFEATAEAQTALLSLVAEVKQALDVQRPQPDGYNVGFDVGEAAGQLYSQLHIHVIPRYRGDMDDPRGGMRHVIPSRGNPGRVVRPLATGGESDPFVQHILPLLSRASEVSIVAAFAQESGLARLDTALRSAISAGARIRVITGDYLNITQSHALESLLDLSSMTRIEDDERGALPGSFEARIVEVATLPSRSKSFHPKSWRFQSPSFGVAFVGSSNLSWSALEAGIEWNLRVDRDRDQGAYQRVCEAFEALWSRARILDAAWVERYAERVRSEAREPLEAEGEAVEPEPLHTPHRVQQDALAALRGARRRGQGRALVVLATGLGKTWLAAFDYAQLAEEIGSRPRLLFLAHRRELLRQAAKTYRRLMRQRGERAQVGWFVEDESDLHAPMVFASVAKLARPNNLERLRAQRFDYVVIDEVHHAAAESYRRIAAALDTRFLLGLTATPDRADAADILGLFDDHLAFSADLIAGIELGRLVPFHYFGVRDDIDYDNIPWRNRRWDPEALAAAVQTEQRMQTLWTAWNAHPGVRTLVFCSSIAHAKYVKAWLHEQGVRVRAVFAAEGSDEREATLAALERGELDAVCAVDLFNEGIDVPAIDRVVMLRPTESGVVFLQQLGRGLRAFSGKAALTVIDFVGNHRVFLGRLQKLLSLSSSEPQRELQKLLAEPSLELPAGCSVELEIEAKQMLQSLYRSGGADEVERAYRQLRATRGERPSAGELQRMGYVPSTVAVRHGSWFEFVRGEGDLDELQKNALDLALPFLRELEKAVLKTAVRLVALEALLEADALFTGLPQQELGLRVRVLIRRSPELGPGADTEDDAAWSNDWSQKAIVELLSGMVDRRAWFRTVDDRVSVNLVVPGELYEPLATLTRELVDYRLALYRRRHASAQVDGFVCKVVWNKRDPILKLPNRKHQDVPEGPTDVRLPDSSVWQFDFVKEFVNVARPPGKSNQLPDLLRRWFGPNAGHPGTAFQVRFFQSPDGLWIEPIRNVITLMPKRAVVAYPDLRAAAGHVQQASEQVDLERVFLPVEVSDPNCFAVRVSGTSMDGGAAPLRDGDWALMRLARGASAESVVNRVVLVQTPDPAFGWQYQIKRLVRRSHRWLLVSDNPSGPTIEPSADVVVIARLERGVRPEELAPAVGTVIASGELAETFGVEGLYAQSGRIGGHLFVFVDRERMLAKPDELVYEVERVRPSETAFVLAKQDDGGSYRYLGVGRQTGDANRWRIPEVSFTTWRTWGAGKEVSRNVADDLIARARAFVERLVAPAADVREIVRSDGRRARVLGPAARSGFRIDGGEGGFAERTVSLLDVAWVIAAADHVRLHGGLLDERLVNRLRYLEGTPKGSTRWIDSGWAIAAWSLLGGGDRSPP